MRVREDAFKVGNIPSLYVEYKDNCTLHKSIIQLYKYKLKHL